ncbi:MmcQ/YjbR family DNA-binding protein [Sphingomonas sp.]|jgi:hypothetical protein|uniref:MmcQ/YjbR family DNA-binding protein n=1 Tax=Sphingomonas sp. TaxID=28214 RepID=UPI002D7FD989|nr:MmcQ/YjbR family DNA-binding protein [Sphingomonas sp.]HEU0045053.1 MmcQ/YjbR family DNA-binding protein [Sphingomonas sp.]
MKDWAAVVAAGLRLPGVEQATTYGKPALKMRGKMIAAATAPDSGSFVLAVSHEEKEVLLDTEPGVFWQTAHYDGWPAILVLYGSDADARIALLLARAWWDRATVAQRWTVGERP